MVLGRTLRATAITVAFVVTACGDGGSQALPASQTELSAPSRAAQADERCSPEAVRSTVEAFLQEAQASPVRAVQQYIAPEPLFEWFSAEGRLGSDSRDRGTLVEFLKLRSTDAGQSELVHFERNGRGQGIAHFGFRIRRAEGDSSSVFPGKGALDCGSGTIVVWSEGAPPN